jgi:hypothetical protein
MPALQGRIVGFHKRFFWLCNLVLGLLMIPNLCSVSANDFEAEPQGRPKKHGPFNPSRMSSKGEGRDRSPQHATIQTGFVIRDGEYIPPPYALTEDADQVLLNGETLPAIQSAFRHVSFGGPHLGRFGPMPRRSIVRSTLEDNGVLLVENEKSLTIRPEFTGRFLATLLSDEDNESKIYNLSHELSGPGFPSNIDWSTFVNVFVPNRQLDERYDAMFVQPLQMEQENAEVSTFSKRTIRYAMTVAGMIFGVFGFGMLLQHQPHVRVKRGEVDREGPGFQFLPLYVALVFLFGMFDLTCTLFANETGGLLELNPLGDRLVNNPIGIILSKILVTALSVTILVALRKYRVAQITSWWLCLVCVFLTFRWVTFTSMFLS